MRGESSTNNGAEKNVEKCPEKVVVEQNKAHGNKIETITEAGPVSRSRKSG
jgi:hypothetical protein